MFLNQNVFMKPKLKTLRKVANKVGSASKSHKKLKVKSSSKKRFHLTGTGKVVATQANKRHNMRKRSTRQIRNQRGTTVITDTNIILKYHNLHLH